MTVTDEKTGRAGGRGVVEELRAWGGLDGVFERIDSGQVELTGSDGLLSALLKEALERGLQAELTDHMGYEKGRAHRGCPWQRAQLHDGQDDRLRGRLVRDRGAPGPGGVVHAPAGAQGASRGMGGLDAMIISLYAGGMTVREIRHHLDSTLGVELSAGTISKITDAVREAVLEWQARPLEALLPGDLPGRDPCQDPR